MQREMAFLFKFGIDMQTGQPGHQPVLLEEVLKYLSPKPGGMYIDGTVGGGGHTEAILARSAPDGKVLGIDTDAQALERVGKRLASMVNNGRLTLVQGNFAHLATIAQQAGFTSVQGVLLDLGFSSIGFARLVSMAVRRVGSSISPQCLHFRATDRIDSPQ